MVVKVKPKTQSYKMTLSASNIWFALVSSPKDGRRQATNWFSCRDHINDVLIASANGQNHSYHTEATDPPFDYERLRLLIAAKEEAKPYIFTAKRILNIYEDLGKFSKKSVIVTVKGLDNVDSGIAWLLTGPKEWMLCSQLTSMVTLITRICFRLKADLKGKKMPKDIKELNAFWKDAVSKSKDGYASWDVNTSLATGYLRWQVLIENFGEIFKDLTVKDLYPKSEVGCWHGPGGIYSLSTFSSNINKLDKRFKEKCKKAGIIK